MNKIKLPIFFFFLITILHNKCNVIVCYIFLNKNSLVKTSINGKEKGIYTFGKNVLYLNCFRKKYSNMY